jgi:hypothetical protein
MRDLVRAEVLGNRAAEPHETFELVAGEAEEERGAHGGDLVSGQSLLDGAGFEVMGAKVEQNSLEGDFVQFIHGN